VALTESRTGVFKERRNGIKYSLFYPIDPNEQPEGKKMNALEMSSISKRFGNFYAVKNLSLTIPRGTIYGLLGPNGAGKTTTIRMVMNIILPDEGTVQVLGQRLDEGMKERIGYLPEDRGLYPKMRVGEQLLFFSEIKGLKGEKARKRIDEWLERFDLAAWKQKKVEELSRGMQQKLQFIATVIHSPDLVILDEPFSGLDPVNTKLLKDIMLEMKAGQGTVIFSTHRMEQVEMICDNICLINKAQRVLEGNLNQIKKQYGKNTVILDYEGDAAFIRDLPEVSHVDDYGKHMEIRIEEGTHPRDLLSKLVQKININRFEVKEPTLNAIFIDKVGEGNEKNTDRH
jgi:ABC-2 type transport system ATP-binding protein